MLRKPKNGQFRPDEQILEMHSCRYDGRPCARKCSRTAAPSFLQKNVEKGVVNPDLAVIFDEAQLSEAIHKKAHPGSGCANHISQYLLADLGNHRLGFAFFAELR